jgi:hypothetical protein
MVVNYYSKKILLFLRLKYSANLLSYCSYLPSFRGKFNVIKIPMVIYHHFTVITKVMLLYNTEWQYDHGMAVNYHRKKLYNIFNRKQETANDRSLDAYTNIFTFSFVFSRQVQLFDFN